MCYEFNVIVKLLDRMADVNDVGSSQQMTEKTEGKTAYEENKNYLYYGTSIQ